MRKILLLPITLLTVIITRGQVAQEQTYDYSGRWDFDADGKTDQVLFIGTGGAHLYYYMRIVLSSDNKVHNYPFLEIDMPLLQSMDLYTQFSVGDFNGDKINDIFLLLDQQTFSASERELKKYGVTSKRVLITVKKRKIMLQNYPE